MTPQANAAAPLLITMGDAAGIGPELIVKAWFDGAPAALVVGCPQVLRRAAAVVRAAADRAPGHGVAGGVAAPMIAVVEHPSDLAGVPAGCLAVCEPPGLPPGLAELPWGRVDARAGTAAARCIEHAVRLVQAGAAAGLVTAPLHKEALAAAGVPYPGHTEMLQALAAAGGAAAGWTPPPPPPPVRMMLANGELRVVLVTIHQSLRRAIDAVTFDAVLQTIRIADAAARAWQPAPPRIAVAGLNPHAGEGGLFGDEELRVIGPAVEAARAEGIDASGPHPPDTVFMRARRGAFDLVVAMTHDQGLIPVKYLGVDDGVNVTLGLPFVRTSPDHGTAFDIAGQGVADPASLRAALGFARRLVAAREAGAAQARAAAPVPTAAS